MSGALPATTLETIRELLTPVDGEIYLDLGCADGATVARLAASGGRWVGLDVRARLLLAARERRPDLEWVLAKGGRLPFEDQTFDGVLCLAGLDRFVDPAHPLREAVRVLRRGGRLVLAPGALDDAVLRRALDAAGLDPGATLADGLLGCARPGP